MLKPYRINVGTPENPQWVPGTRRGEEPSCEDAKLGFTKLDAANWNIHVHAIGDRAARVTLDNYEAAKKQNRRWDRRHTITHLQFVDERSIVAGQLVRTFRLIPPDKMKDVVFITMDWVFRQLA
jgi:hypothetical protein